MSDNLTDFDRAIVASVKRGNRTAMDVAGNLKADLTQVENRVRRMLHLGDLVKTKRGLVVQERIQ
jgi:hypothetical protein